MKKVTNFLLRITICLDYLTSSIAWERKHLSGSWMFMYEASNQYWRFCIQFCQYVQLSVQGGQYCNETCTREFRGEDALLFVVILTFQYMKGNVYLNWHYPGRKWNISRTCFWTKGCDAVCSLRFRASWQVFECDNTFWMDLFLSFLTITRFEAQMVERTCVYQL